MKDHEGIHSIWASSLRGFWAFFGGSGLLGKSIMDSARIPFFLGVGIWRRIVTLFYMCFFGIWDRWSGFMTAQAGYSV